MIVKKTVKIPKCMYEKYIQKLNKEAFNLKNQRLMLPTADVLIKYSK